MQVTQSAAQANAGKASFELQGLPGWLLGFVRGR